MLHLHPWRVCASARATLETQRAISSERQAQRPCDTTMKKSPKSKREQGSLPRVVGRRRTRPTCFYCKRPARGGNRKGAALCQLHYDNCWE